MAQVLLEMTMTVDGFITAPGMSPEHPLGVGGERLHDWILDSMQAATNASGLIPELGNATLGSPEHVDRQTAARIVNRTGAFVMGLRTFEAGEALWGDRTVFARRPCFVVTGTPREP
ncbi:MAG: hypothetical protein WBA87_14400, partial [Microbacterium sp.]